MCGYLATAARVKYPAALQRYKLDTPLLAAGYLISYDGSTFPFEDNSFDLVVTRYALHHFPEIRKSIREVAWVLKGGVLEMNR